MTAVWFRFRAELRTRWRAWLGLALIAGLATGAVMALAAGARRTDTAYPRFLDAQDGYDVAILNYPEDGTAVFDLENISRLPAVADSARAYFEYYTFDAGNLMSVDGRFGTEINRFRMLEGRRFDPDRPDEMVVGFVLAEEEGLEVGDTVELLPHEYIEWLQSPETVEYPFPEEDLTDEEIQAQLDGGQHLLEAVPEARLRIVGIEASPGEFPPQFAVNRPLVHLSPALAPYLDGVDDIGTNEVLAVRLRGGASAADDFVDALERRAGGDEVQVISQSDHAAAVERSVHFQAVALWLLAGLTALVSILIVGQLVARLTYAESAEQPTLRALGMGPRQRVALGVARALAIAIAAAVVGALGAVAASRFFPTGLARTAEPDPGFDVDPVVLLLGIPLTIVVLTALSIWPAWRAGRVVSGETELSQGPRWFLRFLTGRRMPVPAEVGMRMALDPGWGPTAVPVRSTVTGVTLGITALIAAITFGASLARLLDTPRLYGVTWDFELVSFEEGDRSGFGRDAIAFLREDDRVAAAGVGTVNFGPGVEVAGERVDGIVLRSVKGGLAPPVLDGRTPEGADEILLGARTLRSIDAEVGDVIDVHLPGRGDGVPMQITGTAVFPTVSEFAQLGEGALLKPAGAAALDPSEDDPGIGLVVRLAPGANGEALIGALSEELDTEMLVYDTGEPSDIVNFGRVEGMPFVLGGVLAAIAAATLTHLLLSATRRRRGELAVLKTLGFIRTQVAGTVSAQATTVVVIGLIVGVPLGIATGRIVWTWMADNLGVVSSPAVPILAIGILVIAALLVANAIALWPARVAARTPAATVLRAE